MVIHNALIQEIKSYMITSKEHQSLNLLNTHIHTHEEEGNVALVRVKLG